MLATNLSKLLRPLAKCNKRSIYNGIAENYRCCPKLEYGPLEVQRSVLMNGIKVNCAAAFGAQISACCIMFQAGSRYEDDDHLGVNHFLRTTSNGTGCSYTGYSKIRVLQQYGSSITCTSDRQTIAYTLRCPVPYFNDLKYYLVDAACRCCYTQWDINDRKAHMHDELHHMPPEQRVLDLLQQASFRGPLSNSIFCEPERIDDMEEDFVNCFASTYFKSDQCTIGCIGIPFDDAMKVAEMIEPRVVAPKPRVDVVSCSRSGFAYYDLGPGSDTYVALAVPGCGTTDISCLTKYSLVAAACGVGDMQVGQHFHDRTPMPPLGSMAGGDIYTQYKAFNISYMETGLFGILIKTKSETVWNATMAAAEFLANVSDLDYKQIQIGKNRLKLNLAIHDEDCVKVAEGMALQAANNIQLDSHKASFAIIDMISPEEISCIAKLISNGYPCMSMAVVGDVSAAPHDRELVRC